MENLTVIGIGKLGLGFALLLEKSGFNILGVDIFPEYVSNLNNKKYNTNEPKYTELLSQSKNFKATTSLQEGLEFSNYIFIIVQTPNSGGDRFYDHSILSNLLCKINTMEVKDKNFIIGCTVMPKYIDEVGELLISSCQNCTLSYSPEFVAQGDIINGFLKPDMILIGTKSKSVSKELIQIYSKMVINDPKYNVMTPLEAEIVKISINGYITTKLSFANMISDVCDISHANKNVVLKAIGNDSRISNRYFKPGYSFGGPCFPRDTRALKQYVEQCHINSNILTATTEYNQEHINFQVKQLLDLDLDVYRFENICYKENSKVKIIEESAKLKIAKKLVEHGKRVIIIDIPSLINEVKKEYGKIFEYEIEI